MTANFRKYLVISLFICLICLLIPMFFNCFKGPLRCRNVIAFLGVPYATMSSKIQDSETNLTLYYHHHSYYSKKVLLTLQEKKLPFHAHKILIEKGESYEPWFIAINPKGEIPVLKDGSQVIIDSKNIIDYLNDNFNQGDYVNLVPLDLNQEERAAVISWRTHIDAIEGNMIQFGLMFHREIVSEADEHYPYNIPGIKTVMKNAVINMPSSLRKMAEKYPEVKDIILAKAERAENTSEIAQNKEKFDKEIEAVKALLRSVEEKLASHPAGAENWWLCSEKFTQADVSLAILMDRLWRLGTAESLWGHLPRLQRYFERLQERDAYKRIEPTIWDDMGVLWPVAAGLGAIVGAVVVGICVFV